MQTKRTTPTKLSEVQLGQLDQELYDQINGKPDPHMHLRDRYREGHECFPVDGYLCWQHRWLMGTGRRPTDW